MDGQLCFGTSEPFFQDSLGRGGLAIIVPNASKKTWGLPFNGCFTVFVLNYGSSSKIGPFTKVPTLGAVI